MSFHFPAILKCFLGVFLLSSIALASNKVIAPLPSVQSQLSVDTVDKLRTAGLWTTDWEKATVGAHSLSMLQFISTLNDETKNGELAANSLFDLGSCEDRGLLITECELYKAKVLVFRNLNSSEERKKRLEYAFVKRYIDLSLKLIFISGFQPTQAIAQRMQWLMDNGQLVLIDLSPEFKSTLPISSHYDPQKTTGAYFPQSRKFGIDLSKGISENALTVAHEMVHAADPELELLRQEMQEIYPAVIARLEKSLEAPQAARILLNSLLLDAYYEVRGDVFTEQALRGLTARLDLVQEELKKSHDPDLARDEVIKKWTQLFIRMTVENEFRAHIYSAAIYFQLAESVRLISRDNQMVNFAKFLIVSPDGFSINRGNYINPFGKEFNLAKLEPAIRAAARKDSPAFADNITITAKFKNQINMIKSTLQLHYLTALRSETSGYKEKYQDTLDYISERQALSKEIDRKLGHLPEHVQQGYRADKVDAYTVLSAQISTAIILRFKEAIGLLNTDIKKFKSQLLTMKAGILDLDGITFGELKLLGLESSTASSSNASLINQAMAKDLNSDQSNYLNFFEMRTWNISETLAQPVISQDQIQSTLYRLRLLKFLSWFENKFPLGRSNLVNARILQDLLLQNQYDTSEISVEQAEDLKIKAAEAVNEATFSGGNVKEIDHLFESLGAIYELGLLPQGADWNAVTQRFRERMSFELSLLERNNYRFSFNSADFEQKFATSLAIAKQSISEHVHINCTKSPEGTIAFISTLPAFKLHEQPISNMIALCLNKVVYLVRKSDGQTNSAPSRVSNGQLQTQFTFTSSYISLNPFLKIVGRISDLWN
jgi:hypothetical protein